MQCYRASLKKRQPPLTFILSRSSTARRRPHANPSREAWGTLLSQHSLRMSLGSFSLGPNAAADQQQIGDATDDQREGRRLGNGVHHPEVADNALGLGSCS